MYPITNINHALDVATDWGIDPSATYPIKILCAPVMCTNSENFSYTANVDFSKFDLVLLSDIEYQSHRDIHHWINKSGIKNYLLAIGGYDSSVVLQLNEVYRPWWAFNLVNYNNAQPIENTNPQYIFDCLLGARRPHRDFAMLCLQQTKLIDSSIATYRDFFTGGIVDHQTQEFAEMFPECKLEFPYVSPNLDPAWEVDGTLDNSISYLVPWNIYQQCQYSIVCETLGTGGDFFMSEKTAKMMFAGRIFLMFSNQHFLKNLKNLGFETFHSVIDESYDNEPLDFARFDAVKEQMIWLSKQNYNQVFDRLKPVLIHNQHRILELQREKRKQMKEMFDYKLKSCLMR